jgi:hypothetical protein
LTCLSSSSWLASPRCQPRHPSRLLAYRVESQSRKGMNSKRSPSIQQ